MRTMIMLSLGALLAGVPALAEEDAKPKGDGVMEATTVRSTKSNSSDRAAPPQGGQPQQGGADANAAKVKGSKSNTSE